MLINTVIIFLRDILPLCVLLCYLKVLFNHISYSPRSLFLALLAIVCCVILLLKGAPSISSLFDGAGVEVVSSSLLMLFAIGLFLSLINGQTTVIKYAVIVAVVSLTSLKLAGFFHYLTVSVNSVGSLQQFLLACFLGFGITLSFAVLWLFVLNELKAKGYRVLLAVLFASFVAGHLAEVSDLLSQVDVIDAGSTAFVLENWLSDKSEYGRVLSAIMGYESSPTFAFVITYTVSLVIMLIAFFKSNLALRSSEDSND
ncbi:hypothetical protein [Pseudoalteromonas spongiae]|uniref:High-affinity iron transporter n=1 Tax=Pseudoalteromonas spongiae TaxID=298657 RepID=A0ABU8EWB5_9GAMM